MQSSGTPCFLGERSRWSGNDINTSVQINSSATQLITIPQLTRSWGFKSEVSPCNCLNHLRRVLRWPGRWRQLKLSYGKTSYKNVQLVCKITAKWGKKLVQTYRATNQVVVSCVNTDFWLDKITRESRHTRKLRHLLQSAGKTRNMYRFCCKTWNYSQISATTLFVARQVWFVGGVSYSTRFAATMPNKLHIFVFLV